MDKFQIKFKLNNNLNFKIKNNMIIINLFIYS